MDHPNIFFTKSLIRILRFSRLLVFIPMRLKDFHVAKQIFVGLENKDRNNLRNKRTRLLSVSIFC